MTYAAVVEYRAVFLARLGSRKGAWPFQSSLLAIFVEHIIKNILPIVQKPTKTVCRFTPSVDW